MNSQIRVTFLGIKISTIPMNPLHWKIYQRVVQKTFVTIYETRRHFLYTYFIFFSDRLLSVLRGHSVFSSPPQRPMISDFEGFSNPDFIHYIYFPILILEKRPVFSFWMFSAKQGHYWYHFCNVFGMTQSLTGDWTRALPHLKPALYH